MEIPVQVTFHGIDRSPAIEGYVQQRAAKLETFFNRMVGCHVTLEAPHRHHRHGRHYRVRIDMVVPGAELVVGRTPDERTVQEDVYAAIDEAFDDAGRVLEDHARKRRGDTKAHQNEDEREGRVSKLFPDEGYGFLETPEGDEVYFHQNSVLRHGFHKMHVGTRVRFIEEAGERGPQASTVVVRGSRAEELH
jgi:ribosomal subunit interface protein